MLKRYLIIGLIISLFTMFGSCDDGIYRFQKEAEYYFVNETNHVITYPIGYERFNISPKSIIVIKESIYIGSRANGAKASDYISPLSLESSTNKLTIKFDNLKCLIEVKENDVNSVRNIKNFVAETINDNNYKFTYTFTEADYNRATTCP